MTQRRCKKVQRFSVKCNADFAEPALAGQRVLILVPDGFPTSTEEAIGLISEVLDMADQTSVTVNTVDVLRLGLLLGRYVQTKGDGCCVARRIDSRCSPRHRAVPLLIGVTSP
jgi:hypothetical protein